MRDGMGLSLKFLNERVYFAYDSLISWSDDYGKKWTNATPLDGEDPMNMEAIIDYGNYILMSRDHGDELYCNKTDNVWKHVVRDFKPTGFFSNAMYLTDSKIYGEVVELD